MSRLIFVVLLCATLACISNGMAKWMTKEECNKVMRIGEVIMGSAAKFSDKRTIRVYRNDGEALLDDGSAYIPGETLLVMLNGPKESGIQFVFEAENAVFDKGGCDGKRVANIKYAKLIVPETSENPQTIQIIAGWSIGYDTVKITPTFTLVPPTKSETSDPLPEDKQEQFEDVPKEHEAPKIEPIKLNLRTKKTPSEPAPPAPAEATEPKHYEPIKLSFGAKKNEEPESASTTKPIVLNLSSKAHKTEMENEGKKVDSVATEEPPVGADRAEAPPAAEDKEPTRTEPEPATSEAQVAKEVASEADVASAKDSNAKADSAEAPEPLLSSPHQDNNQAALAAAAQKEKEQAEELRIALAKIQELADSIQQLKGAQTGGNNGDNNGGNEGGDSSGGQPSGQGKPVSSTATRLRRNRQDPSAMDRRADFLMGRRQKPISFGAINTEGEAGADPDTESTLPVHHKKPKQSTFQLVLYIVGLGVALLCTVAAIIMLMFYCVAHKEDISRSIGRLLRRKQGQDKE